MVFSMEVQFSSRIPSPDDIRRALGIKPGGQDTFEIPAGGQISACVYRLFTTPENADKLRSQFGATVKDRAK